MKKIISTVLALSALPVLAFAGSAFADSPGQLEGGTINYVVKDVTTGGTYLNTINANACDEVRYSIRLHNTSFGAFGNIHVSATLPSTAGTSNTSTYTATTDLGGVSGATSSVTVNTSSAQSIAYENGSAKLYDASGNVIKSLPDTITTSGVDVGGLAGSTTEFVNFNAKVNCPTPTPTPTQTPTPTPTPVKPAAKPAALPNTGPGEVAAVFTGASAFGTAAHMVVSRRNRR